MLRKILFIIIGLSFVEYAYSQNHITFNGATFGQPLQEFVKGFPGNPSLSKVTIEKGYIPNSCNINRCDIKLNADTRECEIYSSRSTNTVFRTVSVRRYDDLQTNLMLLVKALEEKYGGEVEEEQSKLGEIRSGYYFTTYHREMLALYFYVRNSNNKIIGEIRISAAPNGDPKTNTGGFIELCYTDYSARDVANREYNSIMKDAL